MRLTLTVLLITLVASCGQKGPLELPAPKTAAVGLELGALRHVGP